jgi:serine protease Do
MHQSRTRIGLAFAAFALGGVLLGVALSAHLRLSPEARADQPPAAPQVTAPAPTPTVAASAPAPKPTPLPAAAGDVSFVNLVKSAGPAVVFIQVETGGGRRRAGQGQGTGFLIDADGTILTNDHVVGQATRIRVGLADGREFEAKRIGTDPRTDIAVIKIEDAKPFPKVVLGDSDTVEVGEWVVAIGNPFGLDHTVTAGIISAKGRRDIRPGGRRDGYYDFIQTDASINPGNSGGPLLNTRGEVIGINTAINPYGQGLGFAIPINMAKTLLPLLTTHGRAPRSWLGVSIQDVTQELAQSLGLTETSGALIAQVVADSPAESAGLAPGDVVVSFEGKKVARSDDLRWLASTAGIGKTVRLGVLGQKGKARDVTVTLGEMPDEARLAARGGAARSSRLGLEVASVDDALARRLGLDEATGAVITDVSPDSPVAGVLAEGDVVVRVGAEDVRDAGDFVKLSEGLRKNAPVRLLIIRRGAPMWLAFEL